MHSPEKQVKFAEGRRAVYPEHNKELLRAVALFLKIWSVIAVIWRQSQ